MKGTAIFGGSQAFTMLVGILRGKLVAMTLGAYGMGISSLLQSALTPFQQFFTFGLTTSAVRSLSLESGDDRLHTLIAFRRILLLLSLMGMLTMCVSAPLLSIVTFGNDQHTLWFHLLSIALFFYIQAAGESTILQGFRKLKHLALISLVAPVLGLVVGVPLYYKYGVDGIVPAMMVIAVVSWVAARLYTKRLYKDAPRQSWKTTWNIGKGILTLGFVLMISSFIGTLTTYFLNTFIRTYSVEDLGLYMAACNITIQSTTMIFSAMGTDYFPHLSSVVNDEKETARLVQYEGEIVQLFITPIICLITLFAPLVIKIFLTSEFLRVVPVLRLIAFSFIGRMFCFPQDYVCLAKGDKHFFFAVQGIYTNIKTILVLCTGYYFWGLDGLGYGAVVNCILDILSSGLLNYWRYKIHYSASYYKLLIPCLLLTMLCVYASFSTDYILGISTMSITTLLCCWYSYHQLDKRIDIKELLQKKRTRRHKS